MSLAGTDQIVFGTSASEGIPLSAKTFQNVPAFATGRQARGLSIADGCLGDILAPQASASAQVELAPGEVVHQVAVLGVW